MGYSILEKQWKIVSHRKESFELSTMIKVFQNGIFRYIGLIIGLMCIQPLYAESPVTKRQYLSCVCVLTWPPEEEDHWLLPPTKAGWHLSPSP
jgi:hypothetical protein